MMKFILITALSIFICCNPKSQKNVQHLVENACEMDKISSLKNAIIFFGVEDEELSDEAKKVVLAESFQSKMREQKLKLVVVNEMCVFGEALIMEYQVKGFPTLIRIDEKGNSSEPLIGIADEKTIMGKLLDQED